MHYKLSMIVIILLSITACSSVADREAAKEAMRKHLEEKKKEKEREERIKKEKERKLEIARKQYDASVKHMKNKNFNEANDLYRKACDLKYAPACHQLAYSYFVDNRSRGLKQDFKKSLELYKLACVGENMLISVSKRGIGEFQYRGKSCYWLGLMYATGNGGVAKNLTTADWFFWQGCEVYGHSRACAFKAPEGGSGGEPHAGDLYVDRLRTERR